MNSLTFVCPYKQQLLDLIDVRDIVVKVDNLTSISPAADYVRSSDKTLINIITKSRKPLNAIHIQEDWDGIPIALFVPEVGDFRDIAHQVQLIRDLKIHVYLPADKVENLTGSRILASLGITCCLVFGKTQPDWNALLDLMTYAVFTSASHAPIEPFHYIANHYNPGSYIDWSSIYFNDPRKFLHLDADGRVALSHDKLLSGVFIAESTALLKDPFDNENYREGTNLWRNFLLSDHPCIMCEGWKICLGKFGSDGKHITGCSKFAADMLADIEQYRNQQQQDTLSKQSL